MICEVVAQDIKKTHGYIVHDLHNFIGLLVLLVYFPQNRIQNFRFPKAKFQPLASLLHFLKLLKKKLAVTKFIKRVNLKTFCAKI
jgi:hypothetical protein